MKKKVVLQKKLKSRDAEKPVNTFTLPYFYYIPKAGANRAMTMTANTTGVIDQCLHLTGWYVYVPYFWVFMRTIFICERCGKVFDRHGELKKHYDVIRINLKRRRVYNEDI